MEEVKRCTDLECSFFGYCLGREQDEDKAKRPLRDEHATQKSDQKTTLEKTRVKREKGTRGN